MVGAKFLLLTIFDIDASLEAGAEEAPEAALRGRIMMNRPLIVLEELVSVFVLVRYLTALGVGYCTLLLREIIGFQGDFKSMGRFDGLFCSGVLGRLYGIEFGLVNGFAHVEVISPTLLFAEMFKVHQPKFVNSISNSKCSISWYSPGWENEYLLSSLRTKSASKMNVVLTQHILIPSIDGLTL